MPRHAGGLRTGWSCDGTMADDMDIQASIDRATFGSRWMIPAEPVNLPRRTRPRPAPASEPEPDPAVQRPPYPPRSCSFCNQPGHNRRGCELRKKADQAVRLRACGYCKQPGHNRRTCKELKAKKKGVNTRGCGKCGKPGHYRSTCKA